MPDLDNVPAPDTPPENERNDPSQDTPRLETSESSILAADTFIDAARYRPESSATNAVDGIHDLARVLTDQLQQHHGCCRQCHEQQEREHEIKHAEHSGLGEYMDQIQSDGGYPDVLSVATMAKREDNLAGQTSAQRKREIYTGINSAAPNAGPVHLCLAADHEPELPTAITFDVDSIVGFAHSLAVAKLGVRWNSTQMAISDLRSAMVALITSDGRCI
ncbi:hypothetical protein N7471_010736 [Penicillium samsonianum]|uniref:uncharacterized protein n=1 Tax=Penicillium samsonianum TaxID=1882272 RepID=UPI0025480D27|nr:uncharacterized protein N7471_010736 [Penicillium samsonianum]KAJ6126243.1 hypothetical protein N7471_010736 [Penicillium samsonianum]